LLTCCEATGVPLSSTYSSRWQHLFGLFEEIVPYDELTHTFTTFSVSLTFYFLFYKGAVPEGRAVCSWEVSSLRSL
jgi:hypothetical protein